MRTDASQKGTNRSLTIEPAQPNRINDVRRSRFHNEQRREKEQCQLRDVSVHLIASRRKVAHVREKSGAETLRLGRQHRTKTRFLLLARHQYEVALKRCEPTHSVRGQCPGLR